MLIEVQDGLVQNWHRHIKGGRDDRERVLSAFYSIAIRTLVLPPLNMLNVHTRSGRFKQTCLFCFPNISFIETNSAKLTVDVNIYDTFTPLFCAKLEETNQTSVELVINVLC